MIKFNMKYLPLSFIIITGLFLASYSITHSYFSDTASSASNSFIAASLFPTPSGTQVNAGDVLINEISPLGNGDDEWVELYNKTSNPINVSGWKISDEDSSDTFPSVLPIPSNGYAVIITNPSNVIVPGSAITIQLSSTAIGNSLNANNEGLSLRLSDNTLIDGVNWGSVLTFFNPSANGPASGKTMSRFPNGVDTNTASDWISTSSASIGISNNP